MTPRVRAEPRSRVVRDRGAAGIWVLACAALMLAVALVVTVRGLAVLGRHRAESTADLAALAAAGQIGVSTGICPAAVRLARANHAGVQRCAVSLAAGGRSGTVSVRITMRVDLPLVGSREVSASARAGRLAVPP